MDAPIFAKTMRAALLAALFAIALVGCGGSGGVGTPVTAAEPTLTIDWPARSRDVVGPASALSATVVFPGAGAGGADVGTTINRPAGSAAVNQTVTFTSPVQTGSHSMSVYFFASAGGAGGEVATANAQVKVNANGTLLAPNGNALGPVNFVSRISSVSILNGPYLSIGVPVTPAVSALSSDGSVIPLSVGSATFIVSANSGTATVANGEITGQTVGTVNVQATVDGISSYDVQMLVLPAPLTTSPRKLDLATNYLVVNPISGSLWASVPSTASSYANSVIEINPTTGTVLGSVFLGSEPDVMVISDDGSTLYVSLSGGSAICRVNTSTRAVTQTFPLGPPPFSFLQTYAYEITVQPGNPNLISVMTAAVDESNIYGPTIYDNGVPLPKNSADQATSSAFVGPNTLWVDEGPYLSEFTVGTNGVTFVKSVEDTSTLESTWIRNYGGLLYGSGGGIYSGTSGSVVRDVLNIRDDSFCVDTTSGLIYYLTTDPNNSYYSIVTVSAPSGVTMAQNFVAFDSLDSVFPYERKSSLCRWGARGLALRTPSRIYLIDHAPGQ